MLQDMVSSVTVDSTGSTHNMSSYRSRLPTMKGSSLNLLPALVPSKVDTGSQEVKDKCIPPAPAPSPSDDLDFGMTLTRSSQPKHVAGNGNVLRPDFESSGSDQRSWRDNVRMSGDKSMMAYSERMKAVQQKRSQTVTQKNTTDEATKGKPWVAIPSNTMLSFPEVVSPRLNFENTENLRPSSELPHVPYCEHTPPVRSPLRPASDPLSSISPNVHMLSSPKRYHGDQVLERTNLFFDMTSILSMNSQRTDYFHGSVPTEREEIKIVPFPAIECQAVPKVIHKSLRVPTKRPNLKQPIESKSFKRPYFLNKSILPPIPKVIQRKSVNSEEGDSVAQKLKDLKLISKQQSNEPMKKQPHLGGSKVNITKKVVESKTPQVSTGDIVDSMDKSVQVEFGNSTPDNKGVADQAECKSRGLESLEDSKVLEATGVVNENSKPTSGIGHRRKQKRSFVPRNFKPLSPSTKKLNVKLPHAKTKTAKGENDENNSNVDSKAALKPSVIKSVLKKQNGGSTCKNVKFGPELEFVRMVTKIEYPWNKGSSSSSSESDSEENSSDDSDDEDFDDEPQETVKHHRKQQVESYATEAKQNHQEKEVTNTLKNKNEKDSTEGSLGKFNQSMKTEVQNEKTIGESEDTCTLKEITEEEEESQYMG